MPIRADFRTILCGCLALFGIPVDAPADVSAAIAQIERMPRTKRLLAYHGEEPDRLGLGR